MLLTIPWSDCLLLMNSDDVSPCMCTLAIARCCVVLIRSGWTVLKGYCHYSNCDIVYRNCVHIFDTVIMFADLKDPS